MTTTCCDHVIFCLLFWACWDSVLIRQESSTTVWSRHVGGSFNPIKDRHRGCLNKPIFFNLGLCVACWACFMCHHKLWSTSVSHPFSFLSSPSGLNCWRETLPGNSLSLDLFFKNFALPGCLPFVIFYHYPVSLLSFGWFVIAACSSYFSQWIS